MNIADDFVKQYLVTALWSSSDTINDEAVPLDRNHGIGDFAEEAVKRATEDCDRFRDVCRERNVMHCFCMQVAHDFWLTRNHHGAGFWDGDYEEELGKTLTEIAQTFKETDAYVGDDGKIYFSV